MFFLRGHCYFRDFYEMFELVKTFCNFQVFIPTIFQKLPELMSDLRDCHAQGFWIFGFAYVQDIRRFFIPGIGMFFRGMI